ncbi:transposon Tf2-9 polyprotein [Trichonephila clavipes]|nr:transposon Tf2-9 polyprotein [Trichonephila clavipes]
MTYRVITDQGTQFRSELFKNIGLICGFKVCTTTSYHPQCNGKIERIHRTLKAAIRAHNSVKLTQTLPTVFLGLRSALRSDTNYTIAQMVYGQTIRLPKERIFRETEKCLGSRYVCGRITETKGSVTITKNSPTTFSKTLCP